jgi:hypothetical protein
MIFIVANHGDSRTLIKVWCNYRVIHQALSCFKCSLSHSTVTLHYPQRQRFFPLFSQQRMILKQEKSTTRSLFCCVLECVPCLAHTIKCVWVELLNALCVRATKKIDLVFFQTDYRVRKTTSIFHVTMSHFRCQSWSKTFLEFGSKSCATAALPAMPTVWHVSNETNENKM